MNVKNLHSKPIEENEKFFKELENNCEIFNQKLVNLNQGNNFYNDLNNKISELCAKITDFLLARDIEKNEIIKSINSGQNISFGTYGKVNQESKYIILISQHLRLI